MKINWECFFDNSSTREALLDFAYGNKISFKNFSEECWTNDCKNQIKLLSRLGYKKSVKRAQRALVLRGYCKKEYL